MLTQPEIVAHTLERAHGGHWLPQELRARIYDLKKAENQLERQQERLLEAYLPGIVTLPEFERKRRELAQKQEALRLQRAQLEARAAQQVELGQVAASIEAFCAQVRPVLEQATFAQRRQLVELLVDRVIVTDSVVEIRYVIPTRPDGPHVPFSHLRTDYLCTLRPAVVSRPVFWQEHFRALGKQLSAAWDSSFGFAVQLLTYAVCHIFLLKADCLHLPK
jgi:site-specific DNA recombinase